MKKLLIAVAATLVATVSVFAGEVEGVVKEVNAETRIVMLEDGASYTAAEGVDLAAVAAGDKVKVTFDDGTTNATAVEKAM
ncbi:MAG: DUF1344 domain-containing protein [Oricola sp.]